MKLIINILILFFCSSAIYSNDFDEAYNQVINLKGEWKFMIGDNMQWANADFNTESWESVFVPSSWENQGFPGYDGYAWYRKEFYLGDAYKNSSLMLMLGYIDDVDEVFINGVKVGHKGSFPPNFWTAYNAERKYALPGEMLKFNQKNTIAVRVYDAQLDGGIVHGTVGVFAKQNPLPFDINLEGFWKFKTGDNKEWMQPDYNDNKWGKIIVPGSWEDQVSNTYDGFGWYRRQFKIETASKDKRFVLLVGKIDDIDEVYLNGKLVGQTGKIFDNPFMISVNGEHLKERYYYLNANDLIPGQINTLAIRVYDAGGEGGIYSGPVGLMELNRFVSFWRNKQKR